jgi:vacuolar-type H+-ATPase subunit H
MQETETRCKQTVDDAKEECKKEIAEAKAECEKQLKEKDAKMQETETRCIKTVADEKAACDKKVQELVDRENMLLGKNIADYFRASSIKDQEMRKYHLFLSLIYSCDQENNSAGVQNTFLLLDQILKDKYGKDAKELHTRRQLICELFNANVKSFQIDPLPEVGKSRLEYNQSHYTVRGAGNTIFTVESPCLIKKDGSIRPGIIHCS